jgi:hypothetical protein
MSGQSISRFADLARSRTAVTVLGEQLQLLAICLADKPPSDASRRISLMFFMDILLAIVITPFMIDFTIIVGVSAEKIFRNRKKNVQIKPESVSRQVRNHCPVKTGNSVQLSSEPVSR